MSSKSAEATAAVRRRRRWSITGRLAFLYTLSAIVTLVAVAILLAWSLHDSMSSEENDFLNDRLRVYRSILESQPDHLRIIHRDIDWEGAYVKRPEYYARITTAEGKTILETPGMSEVLPVSWFLPPSSQGVDDINEDVVRRSANGRFFLLKALAVEGFGGEGTRIIQMGVDISNGQAVIAEKEKLVAVLFFFGILLATGVGVMVARNALRPLREITAVAEQITLARIGTRTEPERWPEELRSLAVAFNGMLGRLEDSFTRLSQLSSNLAHELRTPVNNLLGESEVLLAQERTADEYRRTIESGVEEFQRLSRIIDSLLFLARAENPATRIDRRPFDAAEEIAKICSFYEALAEEHNATVAVQGAGTLFGDRLMFNRAIGNLIANALYYSPPGVRIEIIVNQGGGGSLLVTVNDTGYGIAEEELTRIFDRFYRGERMRAIHPEGSGLGLAIVKSIMDLHGGTIAIRSTPGTGTSVLLHFPGAAEDTDLPATP
ncbi:MAG TPA: heavy metal sensor histidine kinase [Geobacteraceae bacterium]